MRKEGDWQTRRLAAAAQRVGVKLDHPRGVWEKQVIGRAQVFEQGGRYIGMSRPTKPVIIRELRNGLQY